ncbi:MAG: hypothetical protein WCI18_15385, partial [Pseudomonadota bacterium]
EEGKKGRREEGKKGRREEEKAEGATFYQDSTGPTLSLSKPETSPSRSLFTWSTNAWRSSC